MAELNELKNNILKTRARTSIGGLTFPFHRDSESWNGFHLYNENTTITETREFTDQGLYVSRSKGDTAGSYNKYSVTKRDKNGRPLQEQQYSDNSLDGSYTYTYWKNGRIKNVAYKPAKSGTTKKWNFNNNGYVTSCSHKDGKSTDSYSYKYKFNKKGDPTSIVMKWKTKEGAKKEWTRKTVKTTVKNTLDRLQM